ncbi:hypothetical protein K7957_05870 [Sphingomonas yunnanensis]|uniref:hypothetical protein n=1 Tax=Sphingomonas yunnanensis TaxID=310400 RepID=UPI001CA799D0|nr:hypothetical protein [Sphingomonas yunnanensis]MBY9062457.1 hypothetical protein [Sphingomonas yunnanensis]
MTPGTYLAARRTAHRFTAEQLAEQLECLPHLGLTDRTGWLLAIEADLMPARETTIVAISEHIRLDIDLLQALDKARSDDGVKVPVHCHRCGVTPRQLRGSTAWPSATLCPSCSP